MGIGCRAGEGLAFGAGGADGAVDAGENRQARGGAQHRASTVGHVRRAPLQHLLADGQRRVPFIVMVGVVAAGVFHRRPKIAYFRRWPPPYCWLIFLIGAVWDVDTSEEEANLPPHFERTAALGFGSQQDHERDLDDPKWLER